MAATDAIQISSDEINPNKENWRPLAIKEDLLHMENNRRVNQVLNSSTFLSDLHQIVGDQSTATLTGGEVAGDGFEEQAGFAAAAAARQAAPHAIAFGGVVNSDGFATSSVSRLLSNAKPQLALPLIPIDDMSVSFSVTDKFEILQRCKMAALHRLLHFRGWDSAHTATLANYISMRCFDGAEDEFLVAPMTLLCHEVSASSFVRITHSGGIVAANALNGGTQDHHDENENDEENVENTHDGRSQPEIFDRSDWLLHRAIHAAQPGDATRFVLHLTNPAALTISSLAGGFEMYSQDAMLARFVPRFEGGSGDGGNTEEQEELEVDALSRCVQENMRAHESGAVLVRNRGVFVFGSSVEQLWLRAGKLEDALDIQVRLETLARDHIVRPAESEMVCRVPDDQRLAIVRLGAARGAASGGVLNVEELEFEAEMRRLERWGLRTGYPFKLRHLFGGKSAAIAQSAVGRQGEMDGKNAEEAAEDVEIPAFSSIVQRHLANRNKESGDDAVDEEDHATDEEEGEEGVRIKACSTSGQFGGAALPNWSVHTPNAYQRIEFDQINSANPKRVCVWAAGGDMTQQMTQQMTPLTYVTQCEATSATQSGRVAKIHNPNQFAPQGNNPNEFREAQQKIRANYFQEQVNSGHTSRHLNAEQAAAVRAAAEAHKPVRSVQAEEGGEAPASAAAAGGGGGGSSVFLVGSASQAIIKPEHRHDATVYESMYAPNPFDQVTDEELRRYQQQFGVRLAGAAIAEQLEQEREKGNEEEEKKEEEGEAATRDNQLEGGELQQMRQQPGIQLEMPPRQQHEQSATTSPISPASLESPAAATVTAGAGGGGGGALEVTSQEETEREMGGAAVESASGAETKDKKKKKKFFSFGKKKK